MPARRLLILDDEPAYPNVVRRFLGPVFASEDLILNHVTDVDRAIDGSLKKFPDAAWFIVSHYGRDKVASAHRPDLAHPGEHLIRWVRSQEPGYKAYIVLCTAGADVSQREAKALGADVFYEKTEDRGIEKLEQAFRLFLRKDWGR